MGENNPTIRLADYDEPEKLADGSIKCPICEQILKNKKSFNSHRLKIHRLLERATLQCPVNGCQISGTTTQAIGTHMNNCHDFPVRPVLKTFADIVEFEDWYRGMSARTSVAFVQISGVKKGADTVFLHCNRSGKPRTVEPVAGRRSRSAKISAICPAFLSYKVQDDGKINVRGQLNHFGHLQEVQFIPEKRAEILERRFKRPLTLRSADAASRSIIDEILGLAEKLAQRSNEPISRIGELQNGLFLDALQNAKSSLQALNRLAIDIVGCSDSANLKAKKRPHSSRRKPVRSRKLKNSPKKLKSTTLEEALFVLDEFSSTGHSTQFSSEKRKIDRRKQDLQNYDDNSDQYHGNLRGQSEGIAVTEEVDVVNPGDISLGSDAVIEV